MAGEPVPGASFTELIGAHLEGVPVADLVRYAELLEAWSRTHNLVRFSSREELVRRHLLDAVAAAPLLGQCGTLLDVGSGAGLPGVPLLILRRQWHGLLLEPRLKRWAFLRQVIRELALDARAVRDRFEDLGVEDRGFDLITVRALGRIDALLAWAGERLAPGGEVVLWTTEEGGGSLSVGPGWRVISSPIPASERGRLVRLIPCFT